MKVQATLALVGAAVALFAGSLAAHPGGLDRNGCHAGSQPYHCHRGPQPTPTRSAAPSPRGADMDCGDFPSWEAAQSFFRASGPGDPHRLDADNDGVACESLR
ncbi:excalibur calcium-binding domain-containing protein [Amphiplicatus metriothermophilus]|uniref:Excalibur calcium-binding domain-containing protein n=1 Tax=Amphiplicatus metriothermophilus TaxID=1519374 RepID=A0A239PLG7_9PROT|nr:excalibur calcium-binding domain-containing protein [Amphiplicatus metriothermophilus]MBB5517492.1 hypothetical protein [Amphiplicatus metriothermophilus]SNT68173.1 Excalibur calcium-binding domain-containing protein [Amphiplicatus metriothermophilus]